MLEKTLLRENSSLNKILSFEVDMFYTRCVLGRARPINMWPERNTGWPDSFLQFGPVSWVKGPNLTPLDK